MFGKLLKNEFIATSRSVPIAFLISASFSALFLLTSSFIGTFLAGLSLGLIFMGVLAQNIIVWILLIVRYYRTMYGAEGYLSHTLPLKSCLLFWSKFCSSAVWIFLSVLFSTVLSAGLVWFFARQNGADARELSEWIDRALYLSGLSPSLWQMVLLVTGVLFTSSLGSLILFFFAVTMGSTPPFQFMGIGGPVVMYLILYVAQQILGVVTMLFTPFGIRIEGLNPSASEPARWSIVFESFVSSVKNAAGKMPYIPLGSYCILTVISVGLLFPTLYLVKKKTSLR